MPVLAKKNHWTPPDNELTQRRREEILSAAARFFAEQGYQNADLQLLADQVGIGKGMLYRYFPSKEELFLAAVDRGMRHLHAFVQSRCDGVVEPLERIRTAIGSFFAFFDANPEVVELLIQERAEFRNRKEPTYMKHRQANVGPWEELMRKLIQEKRMRPIQVRRIGDKISNMLYGTLFTTYFAGGSVGFEEQAEDAIEIIFLGILSNSERLKTGRST